MAYIGRRPDEVFRAQAEHATFTGDGSTKTFDLSVDAPDNDADLAVYVDNVRQEPGSSKSYTIGADGSGNIRRITFVVAPAASAESCMAFLSTGVDPVGTQIKILGLAKAFFL